MKRSYTDALHFYGRIWMALAILLVLMLPVSLCLRYDAWPEARPVLEGLLGVAPIFWTMSLIELFSYTPLMGAGGTYLSFVTGNMVNLKMPCALTALETARIPQGTREGELISTIAIATSNIVTVTVISLGVLLIGFLQPLLESPLLTPAFDNTLSALFGALAAAHFTKKWRLAAAPLVLMVGLFLLLPHEAGALVPLGALAAVGAARWLYRTGRLDM